MVECGKSEIPTFWWMSRAHVIAVHIPDERRAVTLALALALRQAKGGTRHVDKQAFGPDLAPWTWASWCGGGG